MSDRAIAARPVLIVTVFLITLLGIAFIIGGLGLVYLHSTGETEFHLFGNSFKSANSGVASIFCGAVVSGIGIRRLIKAIENISTSH